MLQHCFKSDTIGSYWTASRDNNIPSTVESHSPVELKGTTEGDDAAL